MNRILFSRSIKRQQWKQCEKKYHILAVRISGESPIRKLKWLYRNDSTQYGRVSECECVFKRISKEWITIWKKNSAKATSPQFKFSFIRFAQRILLCVFEHSVHCFSIRVNRVNVKQQTNFELMNEYGWNSKIFLIPLKTAAAISRFPKHIIEVFKVKTSAKWRKNRWI